MKQISCKRLQCSVVALLLEPIIQCCCDNVALMLVVQVVDALESELAEGSSAVLTSAMAQLEAERGALRERASALEAALRSATAERAKLEMSLKQASLKLEVAQRSSAAAQMGAAGMGAGIGMGNGQVPGYGGYGMGMGMGMGAMQPQARSGGARYSQPTALESHMEGGHCDVNSNGSNRATVMHARQHMGVGARVGSAGSGGSPMGARGGGDNNQMLSGLVQHSTDIRSLLDDLGLSLLAHRFEAEDVTPAVLPFLDDEAFKALGATSIGARMKLRLAAQSLANSPRFN